MAKTPKLDLKNVRAYRQQSGKNQSNFWTPFGVTQSGGSRYEAGRDMPTAVAMLMVLHHQGVIRDEDLAKARKIAEKTS